MSVIEFKNVWEMYRIKFLLDGKASWDNFWALKDISFSLAKGECLAIIGENGAGKSTVLKLIASMLIADRGQINITGRVSGLLELGAGFQQELTGSENVYLIASLFGLTKAQIVDRYQSIVDFASLGKFINAPVKCYSQGMFVRLAFAIAINVDSDILLIDDTLAVGDEYFQKKCIKKIFELKAQGKTIVFVSHDVSSVQRLCERIILLNEGRMVKDGPANEVIPLYTQVVGTREGIGVITKQELNLVFNNGRLFLNHKNNLLTPNSGIHSVFTLAGRTYNSSSAHWQVEYINEATLVARGDFHQLGVWQIWHISLTGPKDIDLNITMESSEPLDISETGLNVMISNDYQNWFTCNCKGEFVSSKDDHRHSQPLLEENSLTKCIGVEEISEKLPSIILIPETEAIAGVFNEPLSGCRLLQYTTYFSRYATTQLKFFSAKILIDSEDKEELLAGLRNDFILEDGDIKLEMNKGAVVIAYQGKTITDSRHLSSSVFFDNHWYCSRQGKWDILSRDDSNLVLCGYIPGLEQKMIWEFNLKNNVLSWQVFLELSKSIFITEQRSQAMFLDSYKKWFTEYGEGSFDDEFYEYENDMVGRCIPDGVLRLASVCDDLPSVELSFLGSKSRFAKVLNSDFYHKARILRVEKVERSRGVEFPAGRHESFSLKFDFNQKTQVIEVGSDLQNDSTTFSFSKGKGKISHMDKELTAGLGLYSSVRCQGKWHDSSSKAVWKIIDNNQKTLKLKGKWLSLPIKQDWTIDLINKNTIELKVKLIVEKEIEIDRLQVNLMLNDSYIDWIANNKQGRFSDFRNDIDDDWDCLCYCDQEASCIEAKSNNMPRVSFSVDEVKDSWRFAVVNSDLSCQGRVLQYVNKGTQLMIPGEYDCFRGKISIL